VTGTLSAVLFSGIIIFYVYYAFAIIHVSKDCSLKPKS